MVGELFYQQTSVERAFFSQAGTRFTSLNLILAENLGFREALDFWQFWVHNPVCCVAAA